MKNNNTLFLILVIAVLVIIAVVWIRRKLKKLIMPNVFLITGAPKTGKTALSVHLAIKTYRKNLILWFIGRLFFFLRYHTYVGYREKPMLYSNIPLAYTHNRLTIDIMRMHVRIPKKSVILVDEASLFADSQLIKDKEINNDLTVFCKLMTHVSYGGTMIFNSQSLSDLHYAIKRVCGRYLYIYQSTKYPFITISKVREMMYSDDSSIVNDVNEDAELSMRTMVYFNLVYKKYDCFCYSVFTDHKVLQVDYNYKFDKKNLKANQIVSFNPRILDYGKEVRDNESA